MRMRMRLLSVLIAPLLVLAGCMPMTPSDLPLMAPPGGSEQACRITVIRMRQFAGSGANYFVTLDSIAVARLKAGEFTQFFIEPGRHSIGVTWRVGGVVMVAPSGVLMTPEAGKPPQFHKQLDLECRPGEAYLLGIRAKAFPRDEADRVSFQPVTAEDKDFRLDDKTYVVPGKLGSP